MRLFWLICEKLELSYVLKFDELKVYYGELNVEVSNFWIGNCVCGDEYVCV